MEDKFEQFTQWIEEQISNCTNRQKALMEDDRTDEAVFEKIKINVYDIFSTILSVAAKTANGDAAAAKKFFLTKAEQIPANWSASYEKAAANQDAEKMQIETLKLDTIEQIKAKFCEIWEAL